MKKTDLKEMKNRNKKLILKTILEKNELSRIEISKETSLSPSTVTTLVAELIKEKILMEAGYQSLKSGRSRTNISLNYNLGHILIISIENKLNNFSVFDLKMNRLFHKCIENKNNDGSLIINELDSIIEENNLLGIGLFYKDDVVKESYYLMYGSEMEKEKISLDKAITSIYKINPLENFENEYFVESLVSRGKDNTLYIELGEEIICNLAVGGNIIPLNNRADNELIDVVKERIDKKAVKGRASLVVSIILNVAMLFSIGNVIILGEEDKIVVIKRLAKKIIPKKLKPKINGSYGENNKYIIDFATKIRNDLIIEI